LTPFSHGTGPTLGSFDAAVSYFGSLAAKAKEFLVFRGHASKEWITTPSLFRQNPDIAQCEHAIIRELISIYPGEFLTDRTMFDQLVRMQHFGLPTRLLDVTKNALVALYFAVDPFADDADDGAVIIFRGPESRKKYFDSDTVSCLCNLANLTFDEHEVIINSTARVIREFNKLQPVDRLVQFIRAEKPYFKSRVQRLDLFRPVYVIPKMSNRRLSAQFGSFIVFGLDPDRGPTYPKENRSTKVIISSGAKVEIRDRLEALGIDGGTLFPEIDRAAKQIIHRFQQKQ
jgi:hypothetical protein